MSEKLREGFAAAAVGYLCKHNATLSGAEVAVRRRSASPRRWRRRSSHKRTTSTHQVVANAAESSRGITSA
jgi:hypothetical protein